MSTTGEKKIRASSQFPERDAGEKKKSLTSSKGGDRQSTLRLLLGSTRFIALFFWLTIILGTLLFVLPYQERTQSPVFLLFISLSVVLLPCYLFFPYERYHPCLFFLLMMSTNALISSLVYLTGGSRSNFFLLYMAVILFSSAYFEALETVLVAAITSAFYFFPFFYESVDFEALKNMAFTVPIFIILTLCGSFIIRKAREQKLEKDTITVLFEEANSKRQEMATLYASSLRLAATLDYHEIADTLIHYTRKLLPAEKIFLVLFEDKGGIEMLETYGISEQEALALITDAESNPILMAAEAVLPVIQNASDVDRRFSSFHRNNPEIGSLLSVPLFVSSRSIGLVCCLSSDINRFHDDHARLLLTLASQTAVSFEKSMLYRATLEDKLRIEAIINSIVDGIIVIDNRANLVLANPTIQKTLQVLPQDYGSPIDRLFARASLPLKFRESDLMTLLAKAIEGGKAERDELVLERDTPLYFQIFCIPLNDLAGNNAGAILLLHDITEWARLDRLKSDFISIVSHELKTPLTSIRGFVKLMKAERVGPITERQKHYLNIVETQTESLTKLINDLLDLSKIESGMIEVNLQPLALRELLEMVTVQMDSIAREKGIELSVQIPEDFPPVLADRDRLGQVIFNLLDNAIKFTESGGEVKIAASTFNGYCLIKISDTGLGIPATDLPYIFDKFYQVESSLTRQRGGTGLGLTISRQLVRAHGGDIWVNSSLGKGTTFFFTLKLCPDISTWKPSSSQRELSI
jgi:signal transduction histidine kinase